MTERPHPETSRPSILVAHPWMGRGGSEATAMWTLEALQDRYRLAFATASPVDLDALNRTYGTSVSPEKVLLLPAPPLPGVKSGTVLVHWQRAWFDRFCQRIGPRFDLCVSAYNPISFGKPGLQLIGDFSFSEKSRRLLYPNAEDRFCHRQSLLRRAYLSVGECLTGQRRPPLAERGDCAVANSFWTAKQLERLFQLPRPTVLYPPCTLPKQPAASADARRDPLGFVCLGRISPEKEIESIIRILARVREAGHPVTLDLVGTFGNDAYARKVRRLADRHASWILTPGFLDPAQKAALFARNTFALHACRVEAFGIAVAEMTAAGLVPIVPTSGGSGEIAHFSELKYDGETEAVERILSLLRAPEKVVAYRRALAHEIDRFRPEAFMSTLLELVEGFLAPPNPSAAGPTSSHVEETHAAPL